VLGEQPVLLGEKNINVQNQGVLMQQQQSFEQSGVIPLKPICIEQEAVTFRPQPITIEQPPLMVQPEAITIPQVNNHCDVRRQARKPASFPFSIYCHIRSHAFRTLSHPLCV